MPEWIVEEAERELDHLSRVLTELGVDVHRPIPRNFVETEGMYNYCPRDRLLIAGDTVVDCAMIYPCRDQEIETLKEVTAKAKRVLTMPRDSGMILDAANICRLGDTWLFLESRSGNREAAVWLQDQFPEINIEVCNFYAGVHIDSTIAPLRDGVVMLNASRVTEENCPKAFDGWEKIWITECVERGFYQYPYASKWIGMNVLAVNPDTVIVDALQKDIITVLEKRGFTVIPLELTHSRTLGGGFHCVTLDTWRQHD